MQISLPPYASPTPLFPPSLPSRLLGCIFEILRSDKRHKECRTVIGISYSLPPPPSVCQAYRYGFTSFLFGSFVSLPLFILNGHAPGVPGAEARVGQRSGTLQLFLGRNSFACMGLRVRVLVYGCLLVFCYLCMCFALALLD